MTSLCSDLAVLMKYAWKLYSKSYRKLDFSSFYQNKLTYLAHTISKEVLLPNGENIAAIHVASVPSDAKSLSFFLGLTVLSSTFVQIYATVVEPMWNMDHSCT